ncbi:MAG TPA: MOP flippase family protein [Actinobacteria bacterium]|nr:MOP flippase family protein [Actinomycetota bacterium]
MGLAKRAAKGLFWVALSTIFVRAVGFIAKIILARLLAPEDFGLLAIGLLTINTVGIFKDLGLGAALIHRKENIKEAADTAFLIIPIFAITLFGLAFFSAPFVATFFENSQATAIIRVLAFTLVISSFATVPSNLLEKELEFKKKIVPEALPQLGYAIVAITLAILGYGVWSLVWGQVVSALIGAILIWFFVDWRPKLCFDKSATKEMLSYGKEIIAASFIIFLHSNLDDALVGKLLGVVTLGYYSLAYTISIMPATSISCLIHRVTFPAYSKIQDDKERLGEAYLKVLKLVGTLSMPVAIGIFLIAPNFVPTIFGAKWGSSIPILQILCFLGILKSINSTTGSIFGGVGKPEYSKKTSLINFIIFATLVYPLIIRLKLIGVGLAVVISYSIGTIYGLSITCKIIGKNFSTMLNTLRHSILGTLLMAICVFALNLTLQSFNISSLFRLFADIGIGILFYSGYILIFDKTSFEYFRGLFKEN